MLAVEKTNSNKHLRTFFSQSPTLSKLLKKTVLPTINDSRKAITRWSWAPPSATCADSTVLKNIQTSGAGVLSRRSLAIENSSSKPEENFESKAGAVPHLRQS